ncbi:IS5 family transposase [Candidatus Poribacteria bacterium]|nr:IS5 family transposase [Candidatus Poribacteria bacterium]
MYQSAPACRWCSEKKGGQALGRSRGGFSTKIHLGCLNEKNTISIVLTARQVADVKGFDAVIESLPETHNVLNGIMDKGYDSDAVRETLEEKEIVAVIPPKANRTKDIDFDKQLYKLRNQVERFINRLKQFRRIATRYEKLADTYLVFLYIVAAYILLS